MRVPTDLAILGILVAPFSTLPFAWLGPSYATGTIWPLVLAIPVFVEAASCFALPIRSAPLRIGLAIICSLIALLVTMFVHLIANCILNGECL